MVKRVLIIILSIIAVLPSGAITKEALADSLTQYLGFVSCVPPVKVYKMHIKGSSITLTTNRTLSCKPMSPQEVYQLRLSVSRWVLGNNNGKVTIYTDDKEIKELIVTDELLAKRGQADLEGRHIALWASHGIYYNQDEDRWKWQRATLWTTVEDVFSNVYARHVVKMLENAHAKVYQPRGQIGDSAAMTIGESGFPRWAEGAKYWLQYIGVPDSIWQDSINSDHYRDDIKARAKWVNWLSGGSKQNPKQPGLGVPIDMALALHTDGYVIPHDTAMVGTMAIYCDHDIDNKTTFGNGVPRAQGRKMAHTIQSQIVNDIRRTVCPQWPRRELFNAGYYEARGTVVPSVLLEMLSHIQMRDMHYGLDPNFQFLLARSIYKGVGRWLEGPSFIPQPLPVKAFAMRFNGEGLTFTWKTVLDSIEPTAQPDYFVIERQVEDGKWQEVGRSQTDSLSMPIERGLRYQFRVIAHNAGGASYPSEILSVYLSNVNNPAKVLIVNAFDTVRGPKWYEDALTAGIVKGSYAIPEGISYHYVGEQMDFDRSHLWVSDDECGFGMCYRDRITEPIIGNTRDYAVTHGKILQKMGISYLSCSYEGLDKSSLGIYDIVDLVLGKEERTNRLDTVLRYSSKVLASGAYIGTIPHASHSGDILCPMTISTLSYPIEPDSERLHAEYVSAFLYALGQTMARYSDTRLPAAVFTGSALLWGVPLESLYQFETTYQSSIEYILQYEEEEPAPANKH